MELSRRRFLTGAVATVAASAFPVPLAFEMGRFNNVHLNVAGCEAASSFASRLMDKLIEDGSYNRVIVCNISTQHTGWSA